ATPAPSATPCRRSRPAPCPCPRGRTPPAPDPCPSRQRSACRSASRRACTQRPPPPRPPPATAASRSCPRSSRPPLSNRGQARPHVLSRRHLRASDRLTDRRVVEVAREPQVHRGALLGRQLPNGAPQPRVG